MNSKNSKTSDPHRLLFNLADKMILKRSAKYVALSNLKIYYTWKNIKKSYKNDKYLLQHRMKNLKLPDGSYSISDIWNYSEYILKKQREKTVDPSIRL